MRKRLTAVPSRFPANMTKRESKCRRAKNVKRYFILLAVCFSLFAGDGGASLSLAKYLRFNGTQLDLRGTAATDADLVQLANPLFKNVTTVLLARTRITDSGLLHLKHLPLIQLDLYYTKVTDEGLKHLDGLPLRQLNLTGAAISDRGLPHLGGLPLHGLILRNTRITDKGLIYLQRLSLKFLDLSYTEITDNGLAHLSPLSKLEQLDLSFTVVTDSALAYLKALPALAAVYLAGTQVTREGVNKLREERPGIKASIKMPTR